MTVGSKQLWIVPLDSRDDAMCLRRHSNPASHIYISLGQWKLWPQVESATNGVIDASDFASQCFLPIWCKFNLISAIANSIPPHPCCRRDRENTCGTIHFWTQCAIQLPIYPAHWVPDTPWSWCCGDLIYYERSPSVGANTKFIATAASSEQKHDTQTFLLPLLEAPPKFLNELSAGT